MLFFIGSCFVLTFCVVFVSVFFSFFCFSCVLFPKSNCLVWVCLSTFWCFMLSFLDLSIVFKSIAYRFFKLV